ncbi:MAG TPA: META domain-containing protein [Candidatus Binatus sp.]|nr:META domain-containing protein [Candidatus Binatus sp.]
MRSLPVALLTLAVLLAPTAALAAGSATAPPGRSFVITGLVSGDRHVEVSGKISIDGGRLTASVGCNAIGGAATLTGDIVTIPGPLMTTTMGCPGVSGDAEAMLIKILQGAGPFTISNGAWRGTDAAILVDELPAGPGPGASALPPDAVAGSSPLPGPSEPAVSCPPIPAGTNGASGTGGGLGSSGSGSGGSVGSGGSGGETGPAATAVDLPAPTVGDVPAATPAALPPGTPPVHPGSSLAVPPPAADAAPTLGQTEPGQPVGVPLGATLLPSPPIGSDPRVGKPADAGPCAERATAYEQANAGGGVEPPVAADTASAHQIGLSNAALLVSLAALALVVIAFLARRRMRSSPRHGRGGEGPLAA